MKKPSTKAIDLTSYSEEDLLKATADILAATTTGNIITPEQMAELNAINQEFERRDHKSA